MSENYLIILDFIPNYLLFQNLFWHILLVPNLYFFQLNFEKKKLF